MKLTEFVTPAKSPLTSETDVAVGVGTGEYVLPPQAANSKVRANSIAVIKLVLRIVCLMFTCSLNADLTMTKCSEKERLSIWYKKTIPEATFVTKDCQSQQNSVC